MAIKFSCDCGHRIGAPDEFAGRKARCPGCGGVVEIPAASPPPPPTRPPSRTPTDYNLRPVDAPTAAGHIKFHCENCGHRIGVPAAKAGKKGRCPECGERIVVPATSSAVPPPRVERQEPTDYDVRVDAHDDATSSAPAAGGTRRAGRPVVLALAACALVAIGAAAGFLVRPRLDGTGQAGVPPAPVAQTSPTPATATHAVEGPNGAAPPPASDVPNSGTAAQASAPGAAEPSVSPPSGNEPPPGPLRIVGSVSTIDSAASVVVVDGAPKGGARIAYRCAMAADCVADVGLLWPGLKLTIEGDADAAGDPALVSACRIADADKPALYRRAREVLADTTSKQRIDVAQSYADLIRRLGSEAQASAVEQLVAAERRKEALAAASPDRTSPGAPNGSPSEGAGVGKGGAPSGQRPPDGAPAEPSVVGDEDLLRRFQGAFAAARADPDAKMDALGLLRGALDRPEILKEIGRILNSEGEPPSVREAAAGLLARSGSGGAVAYLESCLKSSLERQATDEGFPQLLISSIGAIARPQSVRALAKILADRAVRLDDERSLRIGSLAIEALGGLRSPDSVDALLKTYAWLEGKKLKAANAGAGDGALDPDMDEVEEDARRRFREMSDDELWKLVRNQMIRQGRDPDEIDLLYPPGSKLRQEVVKAARMGLGGHADSSDGGGAPAQQALEREQRRLMVVGEIEGVLQGLTGHAAQGHAEWKKWWTGARKSYAAEIEPDADGAGAAEAVGGDDEDARKLLSFATSFEKGGQTDKAIEKYRLIVDRYPDSAQAAEARKRLDALQPAK